MIKVGQIFDCKKENLLMCITKINDNSTYSYILNNGYTGYGCYEQALIYFNDLRGVK